MIAASPGASKEAPAREFGTHEYVNFEACAEGKAIQKLSSAKPVWPLPSTASHYAVPSRASVSKPTVVEFNIKHLCAAHQRRYRAVLPR